MPVMPTVLRTDGYRFFFYSLEGHEPPHIHVEQAERVAKFWSSPVELATSDGFRATELNRLRAMVILHRATFERAWHEHFRNAP